MAELASRNLGDEPTPSSRDVAGEACGSTEHVVFLIARQGEERDVFGAHIEDAVRRGSKVAVVCCARSDDDPRGCDRDFIGRCRELGLHEEQIVFAYDRALPGTLVPWTWAEQLKALLAAYQPAHVWACVPQARQAAGLDSSALGLAALCLLQVGTVTRCTFVDVGAEGSASCVDAAELSFEACMDDWFDAAVQARVERQRAEDECEREALLGQLDAIRSSRAYRLGSSVAAPWRRLVDAVRARKAR